MTKKEAISQLKNDFVNRIVASHGFDNELDKEMAKALKVLKEYVND